MRWFLFGRYSHLVRAVRDHRLELQDTILDHRITMLRAWIPVRLAVSVLLSLGAVATALSALAKAIPGGLADHFIVASIAFSSALTLFLTVAYLFLTRLLGQLEIDVLAILALEHSKK
jgi:hypothetical protein